MSYIGKIPANAVLTTADLADGIVTAAKIEDGTVVAAEIASNAVTTAKINADAVTAAKIADNAVVTAAINADAVDGTKIADDAINSEHYTDGSIDTAHIADVNVTQGKIADQAINEAKMQISNAPTNGYILSAQSGNTGGLTWAEAGGGIEMIDFWRISADTSGATNATVSANWERVDTDGAGFIGTGLSQSSGIFSFPSTGIYKIDFSMRFQINGDNASNVSLDTTLNNSSYGEAAVVSDGEHTGGSHLSQGANFFVFDVTNTTNCKFLFRTHSMSTNCLLKGDTSAQSTGFVCTRIGDT
jgi:hypothetical protein